MLLLEDKYDKIAKLLNIPDCFGPDEEQNCWELDDIHYTLVKHHYRDFEFDNGVSKCALIFKDLNYVMKLPFTGSHEEVCIDNGHYDEDDRWVEGEYEYEFIEFENADSANGWDYCAAELDIYEAAIGTEFEKMFAKTYYGGETKYGHPYYLQEKVVPFNCDCSGSHTPTEGAKELANKIRRGMMPVVFLGYVIDLYGEEYCIRFIDYLKSRGITDLHGGNVGFSCTDDRPVILDSSSWGD